MTSRLTPLRQIEAKRLLTHLFSQEPFNADLFVELLAGVMVDTPEIITIAARQLEVWNESNNTGFLLKDVSYAEIAEVVLDAAAVYHGETSEELHTATPADFDVWRRTLGALRGNRDCLLRAAGGQVSRGAWEAQAAACGRALADLEQLLGNAGMLDSDTEV